jgi:2-phosphosulfolactate phosphatase
VESCHPINGQKLSPDLYRCHLDWGQQGALRAANRKDVVVIVDTLSFSTAVAAAVHHEGLIYPCPERENAVEYARRVGGEAAVSRCDVPAKGRFSLSPLTYLGLKPGTRIVLPSPNGATCCYYAREASHLIVGAFVNAEAVAAAVSRILDKTDLSVTIVACGEQEKLFSGGVHIRFAVEDYLAAGAVISYLKHEKSPEAHVCEGAFLHIQDDIHSVLWDCESSRELREDGYGSDVEFAAQFSIYDSVPVMKGVFLERLS